MNKIRNIGSTVGINNLNQVKNSVLRHVKEENLPVIESVLRRQIEAGMSLPEMVKKNHCTESTIRTLLDHFGLKTIQAQRGAAATKDVFERKIARGASQNEIAKELGIHVMQVGKLLKKCGLETHYQKIEKMIKPQDILDMKESGVPNSMMAEIFGVPEKIMKKLLEKFGFADDLATRTKSIDNLPDNFALNTMINKKGMTLEEIAEEYNVSVNILSEHLKKANISKRVSVEMPYNRIQELANEGKSIREIAEITDLSTKDIQKIVEMENVKIQVPKETFLSYYEKYIQSLNSGEKNVTNPRIHFGFSVKQYDKLFIEYKKEIAEVYNRLHV